MQNNILIISHTFPPAPGIGGRRWAKFAKYLSRAGNNVYVLAAENIQKNNSEWLKDVKEIEVEYLPNKFPKIISDPIKSVFDKMQYHFALTILKLFDKGNYYDKSIFWRSQLEQKVSWYIENRAIDTVIVTGGPFRLVYHVICLKNKFRHVTFISDFRDLWTEDFEISALAHLSSSRRGAEKKFEMEAVDNSDFVFTVSDVMKNYFSGLTAKDNCIVIPNGYDPDDLNGTPAQRNINGKINFVFAGTLYDNLDYILAPFFHAVRRIKVERPDLYAKLNFEFYGKFPPRYIKHLSENGIGDSISVLGGKPYSFVSEKIGQAHYGVLFLNDSYNYSFSTKFCEYIGQRKKILVVAKGGSTSEYVVKKKLGFYINPDNAFSILVECMEQVIKNNMDIELNEHFDETVFSIENIATLLTPYLNQETAKKDL